MPFAIALFVLLASMASAAAEKQWTEVRSQHFRVLTDGSDKDARRVAREFEQMRFAMAELYPHLRLDSGSPLLVLAPRGEASMMELAPAFRKRKGFTPAGFFHHGWDKQFAIVRLDEIKPGAYDIVYHEYTHSIMHLNLRWLPLWLDEGLADFHANTRFEKDRIVIGVPNTDRIKMLRSQTLVPLATLLAVNQGSPYYHDEYKASVFYSESWLLTHFLFFSPGMENGKKLWHFARLLQEMDEKKAFQQEFGDPNDLQERFEKYAKLFAITGAILDSPAHTDEKDFASRTLTQVETKAELGSYSLWSHDLATARPLIEEALKLGPKLGLAHESMGFLYFAAGKDDEARREFSQALELDPKLYLSLFSLTMLSPQARSNVPADQAAFRDSLMKVLDLNPDFAPAFVQLARLYLRQGDLTHAYGVTRKAESLEPARAGYHLLAGQILLRMGRGTEAAGFARYVADRWPGPDHDEAVELWNAVPAALRPAGDALMPSPMEGTELMQGTVKSVRCPGKETGLTVVLDHEGQQVSFAAKSGVVSGFSDTLWYGEDHFSSCRHVEGLRAVVHYKPSADKNYAGELARLDFRDDLPATTESSAIPAQ
ncbi:MAG TPA: tetratricopeptide repeat protein, partial [Candidatus Solibacter sp.]|nr:tetratricopeptide repeat protein [Candidatus Solibacter sp.]